MKLILLITDVGGPVALHTLLSEIPKDIPCPIMVLPSSEVGLLESSAAALRRTIALPIFMIQPRMKLESGCVFFGAAGILYRPIRIEGMMALEAIHVNKEEEYLRKTIENLATAFSEELTVIFLSGRGRRPEIQAGCSVLEKFGSRLIVLNRSETVVFDMGQQVLDESSAACELTATEIVALLATVSSSGPSPRKRSANVSGR
jgi:two-component system, chemotaxis family, protein-glutamate methylesterase/glutaminase